VPNALLGSLFLVFLFAGGIYLLRRSPVTSTNRFAGWALIVAGVAALLSQLMRIVFSDFFR
jgi:hypothetical protein